MSQFFWKYDGVIEKSKYLLLSYFKWAIISTFSIFEVKFIYYRLEFDFRESLDLELGYKGKVDNTFQPNKPPYLTSKRRCAF